MSIISHLPQPLFDLIGVAGFVFYMLAYGLLQLGRISGRSYTYTVMNMIAASLVLISLVHQFNLASLLIQLAWIAISIVGLIRMRLNGRSDRPRRRTRRRSSQYSRSVVSI